MLDFRKDYFRHLGFNDGQDSKWYPVWVLAPCPLPQFLFLLARKNIFDNSLKAKGTNPRTITIIHP